MRSNGHLRATVTHWAAWAPGLADAEAWRAWATSPTPLEWDGRPEAKFLPAMLRRRCTSLSRIMLTAAHDCCPEGSLAQVRTVFASRHGSINESIDLLDCIVRRTRLSPAKFSHTVHNAQAGLFSIAAGNRCASSSLSAQEDTFACGYLEALTHLEREPERPVLLVTGDVPLADVFAPLVDEPVASYATALLLESEGPGTSLELRLEGGEETRPKLPWPDAVEFLRWFLGDETEFGLTGLRQRWIWQRG